MVLRSATPQPADGRGFGDPRGDRQHAGALFAARMQPAPAPTGTCLAACREDLLPACSCLATLHPAMYGPLLLGWPLLPKHRVPAEQRNPRGSPWGSNGTGGSGTVVLGGQQGWAPWDPFAGGGTSEAVANGMEMEGGAGARLQGSTREMLRPSTGAANRVEMPHSSRRL